MAGKGKDVAEGSRTRRPIDLNLYVGLPPLPPPPRVWLAGTSSSAASLMPSSSRAASQAPRTGGEPEESPLAPAAAASYSPSNALSFPEEHPTLDPIVYSWLELDGGGGSSSAGGEEYNHALQRPAPVAGANVSGPQLTWLEGDDDLAVVRSVRPSRWAAAGRMEIANNTSTLVQWSATQGAAATEAGPPELRLRRAIQISQQHNIVVWPRSSARNNNNQEEAASSAADAASQLARAIQHTYSLSSEEAAAARGQNNPDGSCNCNCNSSFECYICLEVARQPVVTPCGHLFCWACLYRWLHEQSPLSECPVCKGEVLRGDITPIFGRGGEEEEEGIANYPDLPPRPQAQRRKNVGEQLNRAGSSREMAAVLRLMIANQNQRGWGTPIGGPNPAPAAAAAGFEEHWVPEPRQRAPGARRQQRQQYNNAEQVVVLAAPPAPQQQPPSVVDEPGPSRRSRPPESPTMRRTRRRPQP